jgi:hypothetical protein
MNSIFALRGNKKYHAKYTNNYFDSFDARNRLDLCWFILALGAWNMRNFPSALNDMYLSNLLIQIKNHTIYK